MYTETYAFKFEKHVSQSQIIFVFKCKGTQNFFCIILHKKEENCAFTHKSITIRK